MQMCYIVTWVYVTGSETGISEDSFQQFRFDSFFLETKRYLFDL